MGNFKEDGHISEEGFLKMRGDQCTILERLEFTEHISFCNHCLDRYLFLVEQEALLIPQESMQQDILKKAKENWFGDFRKRFAHATVAASILLMCWSVGGNIVKIEYSLSRVTREANEMTEKVTEKLDALTGKTFEEYQKILNREYKEGFEDGKK